jgi:hypothetical protein
VKISVARTDLLPNMSAAVSVVHQCIMML